MNLPKPARIAIPVALAALASSLTAAVAHNKAMLTRETALLERPLGHMVQVDGHNMCVYAQGAGPRTLVFLSGSATISPILDFKSLYSLLASDYRIVVIEKFGYGFSDIVSIERSFTTMLRQDRQALEELGITPPYVLCPHSMSGLEAIMWAQEHPSEVEAIVGLDMALPRSYDDFDFESVQRIARLAALGRQLGVMRLIYSDDSLPEALTTTEKQLVRAFASRIAINEVIVNEGLAVPDACARISAAAKPDVPTLLFTSDGSQTRAKNWVQLQHDYVADLTRAKVVQLDCGHYVHHFEPQTIAQETRTFLGACK